jgi:hypothetical protein
MNKIKNILCFILGILKLFIYNIINFYISTKVNPIYINAKIIHVIMVAPTFKKLNLL